MSGKVADLTHKPNSGVNGGKPCCLDTRTATGMCLQNIKEDRALLLSLKTIFRPMICRYIDEGVVGTGMRLFVIVGDWPKILPQNSRGAS